MLNAFSLGHFWDTWIWCSEEAVALDSDRFKSTDANGICTEHTYLSVGYSKGEETERPGDNTTS